MITKIVEYTVREEALPQVLAAIETFVHEVHAREPQTVYEAFRRGNSREFVHFMKFPNAELELVHARAPYTEAFVAAIYPHCEREPVFTDLSDVS